MASDGGSGGGGGGDYWIYRPKGLYDGWRHVPFPTLYPEMPTAVTADVLEAGLFYAAAILAFSFLVVIPGFGKGERITAFFRIALAIFILTSITLCNFGQEWEVSHVRARTQYRAGLHGDINASIGVKIGLRSVNITLKGEPVKQTLGRQVEIIDYNERLSWDNEGWTVGRAGFGPYAGKYNQEFREHQRKGSPYPILWIGEYFTLDGEGIRWGRHYLQAGYYTHIMIWTAFSTWLLALILFNMVLRYGAYMSITTGVALLIGNIIYATLRNSNQLEIPFEPDHLKFHWGWCFWLCLVTGVICVLIGVIVIALDAADSEKLNEFFGVDITQDLEEIYLDSDEIAATASPRQIPALDVPEPTAGTSRYNIEHVEMEQSAEPISPTAARTFRKKSVFGAKPIAAKGVRMRPAVPPPKPTRSENDYGEDYENAPPKLPTV